MKGRMRIRLKPKSPTSLIIDIAGTNDKMNMDKDQNNTDDKTITLAYLTFEHIDSIIETTMNHRDRLLMLLLSRTGCRVSEALAITVDDIDLTSKLITIKHLKRRIKLICPECNARLSHNNSFCPVCGNKINETTKLKLEQRHKRLLPLDEGTSVMLKKYIDQGGPVDRNDRLMLFGINRHRAWQIIKECAVKAGLPRLINPDTSKMHSVGPHSFRIAFTVKWIQTDDSPESLKALQEHLGHQNFATTMRYRKMNLEERRKYYDNIRWQESDGSTS